MTVGFSGGSLYPWKWIPLYLGGSLLRGERSFTGDQARKLGARFALDPALFGVTPRVVTPTNTDDPGVEVIRFSFVSGFPNYVDTLFG
jgi:hypothetical protein